MSQRSPLQNGERAFSWLLLLFSLGVFYEAYRIAGFSSISSPGAFPIGLSLLMIGTMVVIIVGQFRRPKPENDGALDEMRRFASEHFPLTFVVFALLAIGYLVLLEPLGFVVATMLFLFVSMVYFNRGKVLMSALIAAGAIVIIYALFTLLFQVYLP